MTVLPQIHFGLFETTPLNPVPWFREVVWERVGCSLGPFSRLINIVSEERGLFFIQVFFWSPSASVSCSVSNVSRLVLHNIAVLGSTHYHPSPAQSVPHLPKETECPSVISSEYFNLGSLSFVLTLTSHIIFINISNILMCFLNYFPLSWPCSSLWELVDLWTLAARYW